MAVIVVRPTCSNCGHILVNQEITLQEDSLLNDQWYLNNVQLPISNSLYPRYCPYCGERFNSLICPCNFPESSIDDKRLMNFCQRIESIESGEKF